MVERELMTYMQQDHLCRVHMQAVEVVGAWFDGATSEGCHMCHFSSSKSQSGDDIPHGGMYLTSIPV
jgi:hypothetical protein